MKVRTVVITGDFEGGHGENDFVDLHCEFKFENGEVLNESVKNFPYSPSTKNVCFDLLEDEIFDIVKKFNLNDVEKRFLSQKSQEALERLVYKVWRTEGSI
ncbi:MAG: hypothetical protein K0U47_09665 [Epsilonproteobacteria bacterium]|nr:hypothetical protein [Campylobacterota bacterium]